MCGRHNAVGNDYDDDRDDDDDDYDDDDDDGDDGDGVDDDAVVRRHFCGRASSRLWRAVTSVCRSGGGICLLRDHGGGDRASRDLAATHSGSVRRPSAAPGGAGGGQQVRRQSGPPCVRSRLSNQETQILMTTINGQTSAVADELAVDD